MQISHSATSLLSPMCGTVSRSSLGNLFRKSVSLRKREKEKSIMNNEVIKMFQQMKKKKRKELCFDFYCFREGSESNELMTLAH